jgi:hypothetical protein
MPRNYNVTVYLNQEEKNKLDNNIKSLGIKYSDYLRVLISNSIVTLSDDKQDAIISCYFTKCLNTNKISKS